MKKVLVIDDEPIVRQGIKTLLENVITGYQVPWEASNGVRALDIIHIEIPDIIITDIRMPEMDGIEFLSSLKQIYPALPVIVISGHDDYIYVREALKLGVKDYLLKPVSRHELANILSSIKESGDNGFINPNDSTTIRHIKKLIENHLSEELSLHSISLALHLHPNYISQLFKQKTNINLSDYIIQRRIIKSKELLYHSNLKIYDIAHLVGYSNSKHFSSIFKKIVGKTPLEYRRDQ
ncbi:response regulator transcription factor [Bacillus timonensis]|uniref:response regulator transcription factor n=1 Tax=Bacillus timonensis TaxID=1033734 RepID=UPI001386A702|nr:response regulator [Bacillus timonensis]